MMPLSFSDYFPELLCSEDSPTLSADSPDDCSSDLNSPATCSDEDSISGLLEDETNFAPGFDYSANLRSLAPDLSSRALSVAWMLKVRGFYGFQPLTAYLAVNYFDRFLCSHRLPQTNGWSLQLLSVACLSLAAKMEELLVPSLVDFQVEGAKFIFESKTIQRMELLILGVLDWRLRSVTPLSFIGFFAKKLDASGTFTHFLISRSTHIILSNLQERSLLEYRPSSIAASAMLCAGSEIPRLSMVTPEHAQSWCHGLSKEKVKNCYRLMQHYMEMEMEMEMGRRKEPKTQPTLQLRVMSRTARVVMRSSPSSSSSLYNNNKRRKLKNRSWVDDDDKISFD